MNLFWNNQERFFMSVRDRLEGIAAAAAAVERPQAGARKSRWVIPDDIEGISALGSNTNENLVEVIENKGGKPVAKLVQKENRPQDPEWARIAPYRPPILALNRDCGQRDGKEVLDSLIEDVTGSTEPRLPVKVGNCRCRSVWCPSCHKLFYVPRYKQQIRTFDYARTRHVILTVDREKFSSGLDALETIRDKKSVSAFVRKLREGRKVKLGGRWAYEHEPVKITKVMSVLEFYRDGYPHWHLLIEVKSEGREGMIGGKRLHWAWPHGIVKETYFRDQKHWNSIAGYFAEKGYFEKGKKYQTELPEDMKKNLKRRVRRMVFYPCPADGAHEEIRDNGTEEIVDEEEAFREVAGFFEEIAKANSDEQVTDLKSAKKPFSYEAILDGCGQRTYVQADINGRRLGMIVEVPFEATRALYNPVYVEGQGYQCRMTAKALGLLEELARWVHWERVFDQAESPMTADRVRCGVVH
jgi:hypothetical protein